MGDEMETSTGRSRASKAGRAILAVALLGSGLLLLDVQPSGAVAVSKAIPAVCTGADGPTQTTLAAFGGSIGATATVSGNVPASLEPGQADVEVDFSVNVSLAQSLIDTAAGLLIGNFTVSGNFDIAVEGPTDLKSIPGTLPTVSSGLTAGQPFSLNAGPFKATLTNIGDSGTVAFKTTTANLTAGASLGGTTITLALTCNIQSTLALVPIKVPGSPDIAPIPEIRTTPGSTEVIDVLGQYVTAGKTKDGKEQAVRPESLKVVDGPGSISDGKVSIPSPAAGQTSTTTFEVCAADVEVAAAVAGSDETQQVVLDFTPGPLGRALHRPMGFTLQVDGETTTPIALYKTNNWTLLLNLLGTPLPGQLPEPANWLRDFGQFLVTDPRLEVSDLEAIAAEIDAAIEALPNVEPNSVEVTYEAGDTPDKPTFKIAFSGQMGGRDLPDIVAPDFWSILPQQLLNEIIAAAAPLLEGGGPGGASDDRLHPTNWPAPYQPAIPGEPTEAEMHAFRNFLIAQSDAAWQVGPTFNLQQGVNLRGDALAVEINWTFSNALANIDPAAAAAVLFSIFPTAPAISTPVQGVDAEAAKIQTLCSQGVITMVASSTAEAPTGPTTVGAAPEAGLQFAG